MGWLVLKVNRDPEEDRWCIWSTIVEAPIFDGTEAELTRFYVRQYGEVSRQHLMNCIARAKVHGEYTGMIYKQMGIMPREKLGEVLDIVTSQERPDEAVRELLTPFDD